MANNTTTAPPSIRIVRLQEASDRALRCGSALLDRSDRGKLALTGPAAADCLNGQVSQEIVGVEPGCGTFATFLTTKGQMLGDLRIVRTADTYELDTDRISLQALFDLLRVALVGHDAELHKRTLQRGLISLIGPRSREIAQTEDLTGSEFKNAPFAVDGLPAHAILTELGVDILCAAEDTEAIKQTLLTRGAVAITEDEAEVCRIERGRPRFGVELGERTMPQEAGLTNRAVSFTKGCYIGQETVARLYHRGQPNKTLRGLRFDVAPEGDGTIRSGEKAVGAITTVADSPRVGIVALALVRREVESGAHVECGGQTAQVVELPFARIHAPVGDC